MKYLLLYNPVSGKGKFEKKIPKIIKQFKERNLSLDIFPSRKQFDLMNKAYEEAKNYDCLIVSGGDGSINEVINGIMKQESRPKLAIIPSGTANDTARMLGMSKNINKSLKIIFKNNAVKMDINKINDKFFIYTVAAGILTKISYDISRKKIKRFGYLAYVGEGVKDIIKDYKLPLDVKYDGGHVNGDFMLVLGLAAKNVGGFKLRNFSKAKLNDGILELRLMHHQKRFRLQRLIQFFLRLGRKTKKDISLSSSYYEIKTDKNVIWNTDGERGLEGNVKINVLKQEIEVFVSKKAKKEYFIK